MSFPMHKRVVIIGGGVVGVSTLYHLALEGWSDCVLVEKNELTAGSTWHAAGNCPNFAPNFAIMAMQRYSVDLYAKLAERVDYPMNYHVTGSIRLAHSLERMREFEKVAGQARYQGLDMAIITSEEAREKHPFLETHDLAGALWDPTDGDIDPAQLTQALAKGARDLGAEILRFTPAIGVDRKGDEWVVRTEKGDIYCQYVVNAAGYYAQRVGEWFKPYGGRTVPMAVMSHQYLLTEEIPELAEWTARVGHKVPLLRDVDSSYYLRQDKDGLNLGPYERNARAHWLDPSDPFPDDFSFQLFPDDLERLEWYIEDAIARVPILGSQGVGRVINGPIPYAPDGLPLLGPMPGVKNAFEANCFTFGIVQGGGAGKVMSEWIIHGETERDMWAADPRRYTGYTDRDYCVAKALETYGHEYAMHFPYHRWPAGADKRQSPLHDRLLALGAQMGAYNGWERANWFAQQGDDLSQAATQSWSRRGPWQQRIAEECIAVRDHAGILAISGFSRLRVTGKGARDFVDGLSCSRLPAPGRIGLAYFADSRGRIVTEMSCMVHSDDEIGLITAGVAQWHDADYLRNHAPEGITLGDHSDQFECLLVTGPKSREILAPLTDADLTKPWLSVQEGVRVAGHKCTLVRVSFAGELGWEIHCAINDAPAIWDVVTGAGARPFGMFALNSLRVEKGYRAWKGDLSTDYSMVDAGLERFIDLGKNVDFIGKAAIGRELAEGTARKFVAMVVEQDEFDAPYISPIWHDGVRVGETTSSAYGYRVDANIALGMIRADLAVPGTKIEVEIFGQRYPATTAEGVSLWDPKNERLRA